MSPSRRAFLTGTAAAALLAACARDGEPTAAAPAVPGFPLSVTHVYGETVIPAPPQRVVSAGFSEQDAILACGVVPVGIREWFGRQPSATFPWAQPALRGATPEVLGVNGTLQPERIAALRPDVILAPLGGITAEEYAVLSRIAPTVAHAPDVPEYGTPWAELTRSVGRILGRTAEAEAAVARVQGQLSAVRAAHPEFAGRSGVAAWDFGTRVGAYGPTQDPRGRLIGELGFTYPTALAELFAQDAQFFGEVSRERLTLLDADVVVWVVYREPGQQGVAGIETDPAYRALRVGREGRHVFLRDTDEVGAAFSFASVLSLPVVLDRLVPRIAAALDGDPATT